MIHRWNDRPIRNIRAAANIIGQTSIFVELADELVVHADVPGARGEDIDVNFEDGALTIYAKVPNRAPSGPVLLREYGIGDYRRTFRVSEQIDASRISAQYRHGVLTLHLPKAERARPRKIRVEG